MCVILCISVLLVGCGGDKPVTSTGSDVLPGVDASTVSGSAGGDIGGELDNSDIIDPDVSQGSTTTAAGGQGGQGGQGGGNVANTTAGTTKTYKKYSYDKWPVPELTASNKTLLRFGWGKMNIDSKWDILHKQARDDHGIIWADDIVSSFDAYWDDLAKLVAADKSPDLVALLSNDFYPRPVTKNLLMPLDDLIDFNDPLWDNTREAMEKVKWKEKTYFPIDHVYLYSLFYYNKQMFDDFGIEETPRDLFMKGEWTWDKFVELANQFVTYEADGTTIKTAGFAGGPDAMHVTTGVELVEYNAKTGYKINLKDPKLARYFNMMHDLGMGGTKAWMWPDYWYVAFGKGKVAMMTSPPDTWTAQDLDAVRKYTDVVPLPLMEKGGTYYNQVNYQVNYCIPAGAKNPEAAAWWIQFQHWSKLGQNFIGIIPQKKNAYMLKYNMTNQYGDQQTNLSDEQLAWLDEMMSMHEYKNIDVLWQSWQGGNSRIAGEYDIYKGETWASVVAKTYPQLNATIKLHFKK